MQTITITQLIHSNALDSYTGCFDPKSAAPVFSEWISEYLAVECARLAKPGRTIEVHSKFVDEPSHCIERPIVELYGEGSLKIGNARDLVWYHTMDYAPIVDKFSYSVEGYDFFDHSEEEDCAA